MLRSVIDMIRQILPEDGEIKLINRFQYRALKPTWPVAFSLIFLGLAFLVPDQGRAIIKYTINPGTMNVFTPFLVVLFIGHGVVMMYTAFMLSAVTRRRQMDSDTDYYASARSDPVDPSITLRLRYAYWCGVFLPLLFLGMAFWFENGLINPIFWTAAAFSVCIGFGFERFASVTYEWIAGARAAYNLPSERPESGGPLKYSFFSFLHFCASPEHRIAQAAIVALFSLLLILTICAAQFGLVAPPIGGWIFFICFISLHLVYRYCKDRVVRLHQGHTARYIIIDPVAERIFQTVRILGVILIPLVFWWPVAVAFLGPLGVGLFGTLWATLFFSGLVESSARDEYRDIVPLSDAEKQKHGWMIKRVREGRSMWQAYSWKSWFFLLLVGLLFIELMISSLEVLLFDFRFTADMLIFLILLGVFFFRQKIWKDRAEFRAAINQLPSASVLAPILLLGLGEAHHIHRLPLPEAAERAPLQIDEHAEAWLAARTDGTDAPIPAIVILAEGGGIRAGAHAGFYLSHLDTALIDYCSRQGAEDRLCKKGQNTRLLDHVYSINGVSGGAVGSAVYLAGVKEERARDLSPTDRHELIKDTLKADYLAPLFAGLFGSDVLTTVFPAQIGDRLNGLRDTTKTDAFEETDSRGVYDRADFFEDRIADVFETSLRNKSRPVQATQAEATVADPCLPSAPGNRTMDQTLEDVTRCAAGGAFKTGQSDPGPMVFFSTFYETGGYQMATSNVDIVADETDDNPNCGSVPIVQQLIDRVEPELGKHSPCPKRSKTLPLSTAAHLSARFPVSNPTGVVETRFERGRWKRHHFVDGGYMDNSGALTAIQSVEALRKAARDEANVNIIVLHLYALSVPEPDAFEKQSGQRATKQSEFASIPSAVLKARGAASRAPIRLLCNSLLDHADSDLGVSQCDKIFESRVITPEKLKLFTDANYLASVKRGEKDDEVRYPVDPDRSRAICLNAREAEPPKADGRNPIQIASWIPVPLEVAKSDRQNNAITALLGWSLLEETTNNMNDVMQGTAEITLAGLAESINGEAPDIQPVWNDPVELQDCNADEAN